MRPTNGELVTAVLLVAHNQPLKIIPWETNEIKKNNKKLKKSQNRRRR
jgi:hypothetical protein